jgi:putative flippase GtrA
MKLKSLTIFFPFYNDEGTVIDLITKAYLVGLKYTNDLEVIAIHGGNSKDKTQEKLAEVKKSFPELIVIDKKDNSEGYAVIKHGFKKASKEWVFYTDGDSQYDLFEIEKLINKQIETGSDVINGYKINRGDGFIRSILGGIYAQVSAFIFELPIRDTDCDFRLIRNKYLSNIELESEDSSILGELIKKLELSGAKFSEVPVSHYNRVYGKSNYSPVSLFKEKLLGDFKLYFKLRKIKGQDSKLRVVKFGTVGLISVLIQFILFNIIIFSTSLSPFLATIIADQLAILNSFILNNRYTFKDKKYPNFIPKIKPFLKFYALLSFTTLLQALIVLLGTTIFGYTILISNLFFILGIGVAFIINYSTQKRFIWG